MDDKTTHDIWLEVGGGWDAIRREKLTRSLRDELQKSGDWTPEFPKSAPAEAGAKGGGLVAVRPLLIPGSHPS